MVVSAPPVPLLWLHSTLTPHNSYLLDEVARDPRVTLTRFYTTGPTQVADRPWKTAGVGDVVGGGIHTDLGRWWDWRVLRLVLGADPPVLFVVGWDVPLLVFVLIVVGLRRLPLMMWDDGPSPRTMAQRRSWHPRAVLKRLLIGAINRTPGPYFVTGRVARGNAKRLGLGADKLETLPFFVRPGRYDSGLRHRHCPHDHLLLFAGGRLIPEKGFDVLLDALALLRAKGVGGWHLVLVGSGVEVTTLRARVAFHGLSPLVTLLPWAEPDVFADFIHTADVFIAPARHDHFPTTVIAALQAGTPVVATMGVGSAIEFITEGVDGLLVPVEDAAALAEALVRMVQDPALRLACATRGRATMAAWPVSRGARLIADAACRLKMGAVPCP